jgi:hypothetical protein
LRKNYLDGWLDKIPLIGFENNEVKNTYPMALKAVC